MILRFTVRRQVVLLVIMSAVVLGGVWSALAQDGLIPLPSGPSGMGYSSRAFAPAQELVPAEIGPGSELSRTVDQHNGTLITGLPNQDENKGAVYIFERDSAGVWAEDARLTANDAVEGDWFGDVVAVDNGTLIVGAPRRAEGEIAQGAVYVFIRDVAGVWTQWQKLTIPELPAWGSFGSAIDIDGDRLVVAALQTTKVFIFKLNPSSQRWELETELNTGGQPYDVKIEGERVLIGTAGQDSTGTAHLYQFTDGTWTLVKKLVSSDGLDGDMFGYRVGLAGKHAFVHAVLYGSVGKFRGVVYVFSEGTGNWLQTQKLAPDDRQENGYFGGALSVSGDKLAVGSSGDGNGAGSVYIYSLDGVVWVQEDKIASVGGKFGYAVSLDDYTLASAAPYTKLKTGVIYIYTDADLMPPTTPTHTPPHTSTPPPTEVPDEPTGELLVNGGFENGDTGWKVKNPTGDKVKCNKPEKNRFFARTGDCAWRFKGGAGENAKIQQVLTSGANPGDVLTLAGYVNAGGAANGKLKLVVKYADGVTPKAKITVKLTGATGDYVAFSSLQPALTVNVAAPIKKIKLIVKNTSTSGKIYYDDLSLTAQ